MAAVAFPNFKPSKRSYKAGSYPQRQFKALNGATTTIRYGNRRTESTLALGFENLRDAQIAQILAHYEAVAVSGDWVRFSTSNGLAGAGAELWPYFAESRSGLRWRYADAPSVESIAPGISSVSVNFIGNLDAGGSSDGNTSDRPDEGYYYA
jgi:hypothetical protein